MATRARGLGRGLDALLGAQHSVVAANATTAQLPVNNQEQIQLISVHLLERGRYQPRGEIQIDQLQDLADSIRAQGIVQPIIAQALPEGRFEIIAGERRFRAAQLAGLEQVPVIVRILEHDQAIAIALIENLQREDLNALEQANALQRLIEECGMTHQQVAEAVGKSRAAVGNLLRILSLPFEIQQMIQNREIEMGHARAIITLPGTLQHIAAQKIIDGQLSVRATEALVRRLMQGQTPISAAKPRMRADVQQLQQILSDKLGTAVTIHHGAKGRGRMVIRYDSLDALDGILAHIQ